MANTGNTQQQIDYGAAANDGQGDPLRTAFIKSDDNFDAIWNAGPVGSNITIVNNTLQSNNTNGNIVLRPNGVGVIQANAAIVPNATNLRDLGAINQRFRAAYIGTGGLSVDGNVTVTGNLTAGNISYTGNVFVGDLQGSVYADDSTIMVDAVDNTMFADSATFGAVSINGLFEIDSSGNIWAINNDRLQFPSGASWTSNGASRDETITGAPNGFINIKTLDNTGEASEIQIEHGQIQINFYNGFTSSWTFDQTGNLTLPGNTFAVNYANGTQVTVGGDYANANVINLLANFGSNTISTTGNIAGNIVAPAGSTAGKVVFDKGGVLGVSALDFNFDESTTTLYLKTTAVSGNTDNGRDAIYAGVPGVTPLGSDVIIQAYGNFAAYSQINIQNISDSPEASSDYIITADNGTDTTHFVNLGMTSSNWDGTQPNSLGANVGPNDGYIYTQDGNLVIGVKSGVSDMYLWRFTAQGITGTGNIIPSANAVYSLGNATNYWSNLWVANNTIYIGGVPLGVTGNVLTVNGESVTGNITFTDTTMSPPEGVDITISAANSEVIIEAFDIRLDATDDLRLTGNDVVSLRNRSTTDPVTIIADYDNTPKTWTFAVDGTLTAPGDITLSGDVTGTAGASTLVLRAQPASNTVIQLNNSVDSVISTVANLEIRTDVSNTAKTWEFDTTGNLTAPGNVSATGNITGGNIITAGNVSGNTAGFAIGYRDIPQVAFTGNATIAAADAGKHFYSTESSNYTLTIADNSAVSWPVGTAITVVNRGTGNITVAQTSGVSLYLAGNSTAGNRTVSTYGMATVLNVAANVWMINGTGVS